MTGGPRALGYTTCSSCHQPIRFVLTADHNRLPLDVDPDPDGNVWVDGEGMAHVVDRKRHRQTESLFDDAPTVGATVWYVSHFRTCPNASTHRKVSR
jgi:hypothetical protein